MASSKTVTQHDINMIDYFLNEKSDIERWSSWEERKPVISKEFPELISALEACAVADKTLTRISKSIVADICLYPDP